MATCIDCGTTFNGLGHIVCTICRHKREARPTVPAPTRAERMLAWLRSSDRTGELTVLADTLERCVPEEPGLPAVGESIERIYPSVCERNRKTVVRRVGFESTDGGFFCFADEGKIWRRVPAPTKGEG